MIKTQLKKRPIAALGALIAKPAIRAVKHNTDPDTYGGAPLLGVNGCVIISHGSSNAKAIMSAIRVANDFARSNVLERIQSTIVKEEMLLNDIDDN